MPIRDPYLDAEVLTSLLEFPDSYIQHSSRAGINYTNDVGYEIPHMSRNGLPISDNVVYNSYSGADITAVILLPNEDKPMVLGELQTLSYSIHRENTPVRTLGHTNPRGFVRAGRTIAGSMIFYQFNEYMFYRLKQYAAEASNGLFILSDMLPPFDIVLSFSNEYGSFSKMAIYGVTIVDEGGTMSVDDLVTEGTLTYMARGIQPMTSYVPEGLEPSLLNVSGGQQVVRPAITFGSGG